VAEDIQKTAIITPFGLFEYHSFWAVQCRADVSTHDGQHSRQFGGGVCLYGRLLVGLDRQTHLILLKALFFALAANGLAINLEKFVFAIQTLEILGHTILAVGSAPTAEDTAAIHSCPGLQDIKQLQRFLGREKFYCSFLSGCACVLQPLTNLLKGSPKTLQWTTMAEEVFQNATPPHQSGAQHPSPQDELSLATEASNSHIRGVMQQKSNDYWRPLGFFSRKLSDTEYRYSPFDRLLLAADAAIQHFSLFLQRSSVPALYRPQTPCHCTVSCHGPYFAVTAATFAFISQFNVQMLYLPGLKNVVADFLSPPCGGLTNRL
jgi:hypothetical protein